MVAFLVVLLAVVGVGEPSPAATVGFYFVRGDGASLEEAVLEDKPFLTDDDILAYDWNTHTMAVTTEAVSRFPVGTRLPLTHQRFVVVVHGRRCYLGTFVNPLSSLGAGSPSITAMGYDPRAIRIHGGPRSYTDAQGTHHDEPDRREHADLRAALAALGKLTDGIPGAEEYARRRAIEFVIRREQRVVVRVARLGTDQLTVIEDRYFAPGKHVVTWDGRLADGVAAEPGAYLLIASGQDVDQMQRVACVAPTAADLPGGEH